MSQMEFMFIFFPLILVLIRVFLPVLVQSPFAAASVLHKTEKNINPLTSMKGIKILGNSKIPFKIGSSPFEMK